jgi:hypothetical protein
MRILQRTVGRALKFFAERDARSDDWDDHVRKLEGALAVMQDRCAGAKDNAWNREAVAHVAGIERWAAARLRRALNGEAVTLDAYHGYRPDMAQGVAALTEELADTRQATMALVHDFKLAGVSPRTVVPHNDLGDLSVGGWLAYLRAHGTRELLRIRKG